MGIGALGEGCRVRGTERDGTARASLCADGSIVVCRALRTGIQKRNPYGGLGGGAAAAAASTLGRQASHDVCASNSSRMQTSVQCSLVLQFKSVSKELDFVQ